MQFIDNKPFLIDMPGFEPLLYVIDRHEPKSALIILLKGLGVHQLKIFIVDKP